MSPKISFCSSFLGATLLATASLQAQQDAPPPDFAQILTMLRSLRDQQAQQVKSLRMKALQEVQAAAASGATAAAAWEEAVRTVQFEGAPKEGSQFKEWRDKEGSALKEKEVATAAQLHLKWMALTMQRANGTPAKDLLPQVIAFTKEVSAVQAMMEAFDEAMKRDKELVASGKHGRERQNNDEVVKRLADQILKAPVNGSVVAQAMKITELLKPEGWEFTASNADAIFTRVVLPELRAARDPRLLEYWDMKLKREADAATKSKLAFETDKFNQVRRPELLWSRAQDLILLGQRNRAVGEMFNLVKNFPSHPAANDWIKQLEEAVAAAAAPRPAAPTSSAPPAPLAPPPARAAAN